MKYIGSNSKRVAKPTILQQNRVVSPFPCSKENPSIMSYRINYLINDEIRKKREKKVEKKNEKKDLFRKTGNQRSLNGVIIARRR